MSDHAETKRSLINRALELQKHGELKDPLLVTRLEKANAKFLSYMIEELRKNAEQMKMDINIPSESVRINHDQKLYVIPHSHHKTGKVTGYSTAGFDYIHNESKKIAEGLGRPDLSPKPEYHGTMDGYHHHKKLLSELAQSGKRLEHGLHPQLKGLENQRVEVTDQYGNKRRFKVGKSTGIIPAHLELANEKSTGGGAILPNEKFAHVRVIRKTDEDTNDLNKAIPAVAPKPQVAGRPPMVAPAGAAGGNGPSKPASKPIMTAPGKQIHLHIHTEPMTQNMHHAGSSQPAAQPKQAPQAQMGPPKANAKATRLASILKGKGKPAVEAKPKQADEKTTPAALPKK